MGVAPLKIIFVVILSFEAVLVSSPILLLLPREVSMQVTIYKKKNRHFTINRNYNNKK